MNSTLEVVEFEGKAGRGDSSGEDLGKYEGGEKERMEGGGESGNMLCVSAE